MKSGPLLRERGSFALTQNHWWWREGWGPVTRYLTWHLTFEGAVDLHETARRAGQAWHGLPAVDRVPVEWLHLTLTGVGFESDIDSSALRTHAGAIFESAGCLDITPIVFDSVFLASDGVALTTRTPWLRELRDLLVEKVGDAGGPTPAPGEKFRPHVSLAYFSGEVNEGALTAAFRRAQLTEVAVSAPRLSLIELGRDDRVYTWLVREQQVLGSGRQ